MRLLTLALAVAGVLLAMGWQDGGPVQAAQVSFDVQMVGAQENPPVNSPGRGSAHFVLDDTTNELSFTVTLTGITQDQVTASHIHRGARGVNGPIIYNLSLTPFTEVSGKVTLTAADVADLRAGNLYVNAHSVTNPGGFARGQMILPGSATNTTPPRTGDAGLVGHPADQTPWLALGAILVLGAAGVLAIARRRP